MTITPPARRKRKKSRPVRGRPIGEALALTREEATAAFWVTVDRAGPTPEHRPDLGPCWLWDGALMSHGYGIFRRVGAHRVSYWLSTGEEPVGMEVRHHCDNPPCVRPEHLGLGTHAENMADRGNRKLTDEQVEEIRSRYAAGERARALAAEFDISQQQANRILKGQTRRLTSVPTEWRERGLRGQSQKLTDAQRDEIRTRFAAGETNASLSREFQVSSGHITAIVRGRKPRDRKNALPRNVRTLTAEEVREIRQRWEQGGISQRALAREYELDPSTVSRMVTGMSHREVS